MPGSLMNHATNSNRLDIKFLDDWKGDVASFQTAMGAAIKPCIAHTSASYYAILDDDVIVHDKHLLAWIRDLNQKTHWTQHALWGRRCPHECIVSAAYRTPVVCGGFMLMPSATAFAIARNFKAMHEYTKHAAMEAKRMLKDRTNKSECELLLLNEFIYEAAPYNIDHFFSLAVSKLGGKVYTSSETHEGFILPWPAGVVSEHHVNDIDFKQFISGI